VAILKESSGTSSSTKQTAIAAKEDKSDKSTKEDVSTSDGTNDGTSAVADTKPDAHVKEPTPKESEEAMYVTDTSTNV